jgi:hypothetical protein
VEYTVPRNITDDFTKLTKRLRELIAQHRKEQFFVPNFIFLSAPDQAIVEEAFGYLPTRLLGVRVNYTTCVGPIEWQARAEYKDI